MEIKTELNPNDKIWIMESNKPLECSIEEINITVLRGGTPFVRYKARKGESAGHRAEFYEEQLGETVFLTKEKLINSL